MLRIYKAAFSKKARTKKLDSYKKNACITQTQKIPDDFTPCNGVKFNKTSVLYVMKTVNAKPLHLAKI